MAHDDRSKLIRTLDFLEDELSDFPKFSQVDWSTYTSAGRS